MHLTTQLKERARSLWCLRLEARHKKLKAFLSHTTIDDGIELSVTRSCFNEQLHHLTEDNAMATGARLVGSQPCEGRVANALGSAGGRLSRRAVVGEATLTAKDVVAFEGDDGPKVGVVNVFLFEDDAGRRALLTPCRLVAEHRWQVEDRIVSLELTRVISACTWTTV